jgi:hypothetical protein
MRHRLPALLALLTLAAAPAAALPHWHSLALGRVIADAPISWTATRDADGGWVIVEPDRGRWTLHIDSDQLPLPTRAPVLRVDRIAEALKNRLLDRYGGTVDMSDFDIGEKVLVHDYTAVEGGTRLDVRGWHRVALGDSAVVVAHFIHETKPALAHTPDIRAARAMVERLVMGAELNPLATPYRPASARSAPEMPDNP